jgi:threonine dehydrogenase-like Zn-dependent dehydrogenase
MPDQTRVAVLRSPRTFEITERPHPVAIEDEAVVKIAATAVCHTDLEIYTGNHAGVRYPVVMGHEATGTVESVAAEAAGLKPGQGVLINPVITCAHLPLPEATLIETLATVHHAQVRARLEAGESVVVLGQGTTGLLHTRLAALSGADPVIAVSRTRWKLDMAMRMGARHAVDRSAEDAVEEVVRLTQGQGADVVIDTAGGAGTLKAGIDMLRPGGRFCSFSLSHEHVTGVSAFPLYFKEVTIIGSRALTAVDIRAAIELVASGRIDVSGFVTTTYPLDRAGEAFVEYERNPGRYLRIVIESGA